jgi:hypothetical protein
VAVVAILCDSPKLLVTGEGNAVMVCGVQATAGINVIVKSSIPIPADEDPVASTHLKVTVDPFAIFNPVIVTGVITVLFAAALPSLTDAVAFTGVAKASPETVVHPDPVFKATLPSWYENDKLSVAAAVLHSSPVYPMISEEIVLPVLFVNLKPKIDDKLPDCSIPKPLSVKAFVPATPQLYVSPVLPLPVPA